ncbi:MAG: hypothetical protein JO072_13705 [Parafilimonas sp.]|nr:hypothetical protein [Parafilimonas sp.]
MPLQKDKDLYFKFLQNLSRIHAWKYHDKIETERKNEIRTFVSIYVFKNVYGKVFQEKISYNRLHFLIYHPAFISAFKAILVLLELSETEKDFAERYHKVHLMQD